nr:protein ecdysoneless homolog [Dermatophagoides farinae]
MILIVFIYVWWWLMLGLCSVHCSPEFTNGNEPQSQQNKHNNNNNNNKNDSWIIYSFQSFDHNPSKHNEIDMRIQNIDNNPKKNLTPSETLLYHGYIPPVNHLEDPNGISENEKRVSDEPTTEFYHSSIYDDILKSNNSGMIGETKEIQNPPDSIQDLLEPAEARSTNLPEDDPSEDNATNQSPDDDEDFGPDPVDDDTDDSEIIMPQIFLWSNPIETINDDPDENGEKEDDFNLDETQFDQEYPDMLDPQASSPMETSASVKHEITNQTNMFVPIHDNTDNNANIDNNTANVEAIVTGETIIIK